MAKGMLLDPSARAAVQPGTLGGKKDVEKGVERQRCIYGCPVGGNWGQNPELGAPGTASIPPGGDARARRFWDLISEKPSASLTPRH